MGKKALYVASIEAHFTHFHVPFLHMLCSHGYEVHTAAKGENAISFVQCHFDIDFARSPYTWQNVRAYRRLKAIIEENDYDLIHCHTPMASVLTRLAARKARKRGTTVVYTAHGFHFYPGAPLVNRLVYQTVERLLAPNSDGLLLINQQDLQSAQRLHLCKGLIRQTHGVGVDAARYTPASPQERQAARAALDIPPDAFVMVYPAEYNDNKNQLLLLQAIVQLPELPLLALLPGRGAEEEMLRDYIARHGLASRARIMGYRSDIPVLLHAADAGVSSSLREGLGMHLLESMCSGLPIIASDIRGHQDLVVSGENGLLFPTNNARALADAIDTLYQQPDLRVRMGAVSVQRTQAYHMVQTVAEMENIYHELDLL